MTTRQDRLIASKRKLKEKQDRLLRFHAFIHPLVVLATADDVNFHEKYILPKKWDVTLTSKQVKDKYGPQCREIFEFLFVRWKTQWGDRPAVWKVNPASAFVYANWCLENPDATPGQAFKFVQTCLVKMRRVRLYETGEYVLVSKEEHKRLLEQSQREVRAAWAKMKQFREPDELAKDESLR